MGNDTSAQRLWQTGLARFRNQRRPQCKAVAAAGKSSLKRNGQRTRGTVIIQPSTGRIKSLKTNHEPGASSRKRSPGRLSSCSKLQRETERAGGGRGGHSHHRRARRRIHQRPAEVRLKRVCQGPVKSSWSLPRIDYRPVARGFDRACGRDLFCCIRTRALPAIHNLIIPAAA